MWFSSYKMGCFSSKCDALDTPAKEPGQQQAGSSGAVLWLRVLRLENVPDCDAHPFNHGDFYCKFSLEIPGTKSIRSTGRQKSSYARSHFTPVTAAGSLVKFDHMIAFEMPAGTMQGLNAQGAKLVCRVFDKDSCL